MEALPLQLTDFESAQNLVRLFLDRADELAERPFLVAKRGGKWQPLSWRETAEQVCLLAEALRGLGLEQGDRVVLVSENRPEWAIADLAIMAAGCITTPAYTTNTERDHLHILENSGAKAVIVSTGKLAQPLLPAVVRSGIADARDRDRAAARRAGQLRVPLVERHGRRATRPPRAQAVEARIAGIGRRDPACIIYTSGTSGAPRGVLLHHGAILRNVDGAAEALARDFGWDDERFLSFLPLSHALEHTAGLHLPIALGAEIWFAEGLDKLASNIEEAQPTFMVVVPRLFEVLRGRIIGQIEKQGKVANFLLDQALALAERRAADQRRLTDWVVERLLDADAAAQGLRALRRADQGARLGRRAAQSRSRRVLPGDGPDHAARLRPDRNRAGGQRQLPLGRDQARHRRPALARGRGQDRRRDPLLRTAGAPDRPAGDLLLLRADPDVPGGIPGG